MLRLFSLESNVSVECALFIIIAQTLLFLLLALLSVIPGIKHHLEDTNSS